MQFLDDHGFGVQRRSWTSDEDRLLVRLVLKGWRADAICAEFKLTLRDAAEVTGRVEFLLFAGADWLAGIERALFVLMGSARRDAGVDGGYRLGGRQARAIDVVRAANRVLRNFGEDPISYPGLSDEGAAA